MFNMTVVSVLGDQEERAGVRVEGNINMWVLDVKTGQEVGAQMQTFVSLMFGNKKVR